ncbi:MAG TPA: NUDIX hydrolase [Mycobacteriales bacterium]|jgi:8-oxo-dGTP pyrophosphatase MutT (NUDIX family)|nr:NUDIX hydrolase [Mycobacteriales bacterium]
MGDVTRAAAAVLCDGEGRVLLVRRASAQHRWGLPGGHIGPSDLPADAALRELRRETGIEAEVVDLLGLYHLCGHLPGDEEDLPDLLTYAFRCELVTGEPVLNGRGRIDHLGWYGADCEPGTVTATAHAALQDSANKLSGAVRRLTRDLESA